MIHVVTLPALGESVSEGTVTRWLKSIGDTVAIDEPLLEISTDKVDTEIPSPVAGVVLEINAAEDETVEVGAQLAVVGAVDDSPARVAPATPPTPPVVAEQSAATPTLADARENAPTEEPAGTPVVLPALGESVYEGTIARWLKSVGDTVEIDEPLLEISTVSPTDFNHRAMVPS